MAFQMKNGKWKGQIRFTDSKGTVHRKTKNFSRKRAALQWQSDERKRLEEADKGTLSAPDNSKLTIQEWQTQYLEYAFQKWPKKPRMKRNVRSKGCLQRASSNRKTKFLKCTKNSYWM